MVVGCLIAALYLLPVDRVPSLKARIRPIDRMACWTIIVVAALAFYTSPGCAFVSIRQPFAQSAQGKATSRSMSSTALMTSALDELAKMTVLSIDSGDLDVIEQFASKVTDATTNPLFVSQAAAKGDARYQRMVTDAVLYAKEALGGGDASLPDPQEELNLAMDKLAVNLGAEILKLVKGRVSTEVDIRLSYDTEASVARAKRIIDMYKDMGIGKERILIKLAGTWEGIQAAKQLEKEGIQCNITLVFSFLQAAAAAQAGAYLISPFPGRILDWYKSKTGRSGYHPSADPGVLTVKRMYR